MRADALLGLTAAALAVSAAACQSCPSADRASVPATSSARFVVTSSLGGISQLTLLDAERAPITFPAPPPSGPPTESWISNR